MTLPSHPIPAPGFNLISGKRKPPEGTYMVQYRNSWVDGQRTYGPNDLRWVHKLNEHGKPDEFDVVAVKRA